VATILVQERMLRGLIPPAQAGRWAIRVWHDTPQWQADLDGIEAGLPPGPVVVHASLLVARWLRAHPARCPRLAAGIILPEAALTAHALNGALGPLALNHQALYAPFGALASMEEALVRALGPTLFLRPDSSMKAFAGRPIQAADWQAEIAAIATIDRPDPGLLCMIAPAQPLLQPEWRFWCIEGAPVAAAPYSFDAPIPDNARPDTALARCAQEGAERLLGADSLMVVDCARTQDGRVHVVEANGFSTSGFYPGVDFHALWGGTLGDLFV